MHKPTIRHSIVTGEAGREDSEIRNAKINRLYVQSMHLRSKNVFSLRSRRGGLRRARRLRHLGRRIASVRPKRQRQRRRRMHRARCGARRVGGGGRRERRGRGRRRRRGGRLGFGRSLARAFDRGGIVGDALLFGAAFLQLLLLQLLLLPQQGRPRGRQRTQRDHGGRRRRGRG